MWYPNLVLVTSRLELSHGLSQQLRLLSDNFGPVSKLSDVLNVLAQLEQAAEYLGR